MPSKRTTTEPMIAYPFDLRASTIEALRNIRKHTGRPAADFARRVIEWAVAQPALIEALDRGLEIASSALARADKERQRHRDKKNGKEG